MARTGGVVPHRHSFALSAASRSEIRDTASTHRATMTHGVQRGGSAA